MGKNTTKHFVIGSWNLQNVDVLIIQEHWYYENDLNSLVPSMDDIYIHWMSRMDPNNLLYGRPYDDCTILYIKHPKRKFTPVNVGSNRCCVVVMEFPDLTKVLLFSVYMSCDTEHENVQLYLDVLTRISHICNNYPDTCDIIIGVILLPI